MCLAHIKKLRQQTKNHCVLNAINVWCEVWKFLGETHSLSGFSPIQGNQSFTPVRADPGFQLRASKGLRKVLDYKDEIFMPFEELTV